MFNHRRWQLAVGGWWRLAVGGWRLAVGGGWWWWLAVDSGWGLVIGGWWRGWQWLAVGGWSLVAVSGSWWLGVGGPLGRSLTKKNPVPKGAPWAQGTRRARGAPLQIERPPNGDGHHCTRDPPERTLGHCTCAQEAVSTNCRRKFGSSGAYTQGSFERGGGTPPPFVTFRRVVVPLRGPGQSPGLPFACCVGSLRFVGRCGRCSCWCRFRVRGAQSLVCWGCAGCGGMCRLRVSGAQ